MRSIEIPELSFCHWVPWEKRNSITNCNFPGIYIISISEKELEGELFKYEDVHYIGMTNSKKGLKGRWGQFFNSIRGKSGHSGGNTVYSDLGHYDNWAEKLYVSAMPVECNTISPDHHDLQKMGWVAYLEYDAFSAFFIDNPIQKKPRYNKK